MSALNSRPGKLAEQIAVSIERDIIEYRLPGGTSLGTEADLLAKFSVSRSVLREAISLVVDSGLAEVRRGQFGGLVVREISEERIATGLRGYLDFLRCTPSDIMPIRRALEECAVLLGIRRFETRSAAQLMAAVEKLEQSDPADDIFPADFALLRELVALSGNPILSVMIITLAGLPIDSPVASGSAELSPVSSVHHLAAARRRQAEAIIGASPADALHACTESLDAVATIRARESAGDMASAYGAYMSEEPFASSAGREKSSRAQMLALELKKEILSGAFEEGKRIGSEQELLEVYGVSRAVFREAIRILERLSIMETVRGKNGGLRARRPDAESIIQRTAIYFHALNVRKSHVPEVLLPLALLAVELAARNAPRMNPADLDMLLSGLVDRWDEPLIDMVGRYTRVIGALAGNDALSFLLNVANGLLSLDAVNLSDQAERHAHYIELAQALMAAILSGEVPLARRRLLLVHALLSELGAKLRGFEDVTAKTAFPRFSPEGQPPL